MMGITAADPCPSLAGLHACCAEGAAVVRAAAARAEAETVAVVRAAVVRAAATMVLASSLSLQSI